VRISGGERRINAGGAREREMDAKGRQREKETTVPMVTQNRCVTRTLVCRGTSSRVFN